MEPPRGHAARPHTADAVIEAWAPTAAGCYEEAVAAFVELFADADGVAPGATVPFAVGPGTPAELLVLLLEEVLALVEVSGLVPTAADAVVAGDRLTGVFTVVAVGLVEQQGPVPKGVSWSGLRVAADDGVWRCHATVDV